MPADLRSHVRYPETMIRVQGEVYGLYHTQSPKVFFQREDVWSVANQLGRDWCAQGADVEFWTNEEPPFMNKLVVNHALPMLVDGERAMQWIADRFNGLPTAPNCGEF